MNRARCTNCGSVAPDSSGLCKACRIERDEGPDAKRDYYASLGERGAESLHKARRGAPAASEVPAAPKTLEDAVAWASWTIHSVATGLVTTQQAREIANTIKVFIDAIEKRDVRGEIEELREAVAELRRGKMRAS